MKKMKIGIIGRVADDADLFDGQTVTTRLLRDELNKRIPNSKVYCVDTYKYKQNAPITFFHAIQCICTCSHIFILLSKNGLRFFLPFLYYSNKLFKRKLYHRLIGGYLGELIKIYPHWIKYLNAFEMNWVEIESLKAALITQGIKNVEVLPTFRNNSSVEENELSKYIKPPYRFCTFSRVIKAKGIMEAVVAIESVNRSFGYRITELDIYGPVDKTYIDEFNELMKNSSPAIAYKGCAAYTDSVDTLKQYYMLLFPTTHLSEGFPGTITDAFSAGVPIIATNWRYNAEILKNGKTGFCYDYQQHKRLTELIRYSIENPELIMKMKINCLEEAQKYQPDVVMEKIVARMGLGGA